MTGDLFDHAKHMERARRLRDTGMAVALDHAEVTTPDWADMAYAFLVEFAQQHPTFISEDVSGASKVAGFPQPPTDRAWGAVYLRASKAGVIVQDGTGRSARRHASICPKWRSLVYRDHLGRVWTGSTEEAFKTILDEDC